MTGAADTLDPETLEYVTLMAGGQAFGIEIRQIREIRRWSPVTALPHAAFGVLGVINLRGAVVPILDLAARLGLGHSAHSGRAVFVITRIGQRTMGLMVDSVSEIISIHRDQLRDVPAAAGADGAHCVEALIETGQDMIRVVDLSAVLQALDGLGAP
jgi:purine-binding chemotaxis protein CheW